jgi:ABC-type glycerol-3-phosphate transport system permease component
MQGTYDILATVPERVIQIANPFWYIAWFTIGVVLLVVWDRTRLKALYALKTAWVGFSIFAFLWVVISSMGTSKDFVQQPQKALTQFFDYRNPATFGALLACLVCLGGILGLAAVLGRHSQWSLGRKYWVHAGQTVLGTAGLLALLAGAHLNGFDQWYSNYVRAWTIARMGEYMLNSVMISVGSVGLIILCASMATYALTKLEFPGRDGILYIFVGALAIPAQLILVPLFLMMRGWNIQALDFSFMDSRFGLILIYTALSLPFTIFLLTGFFRSLPSELGEAAAIDGCGEFTTFSRIYFPLAAPGLTTAAIFNFIGIWNEYNFALVFITNPQLKTLPVGLYYLVVTQQYAAEWPALFAGIVILFVPTFLIFLILQKQIIAGLTLGGVKE